MALVWLWLFVAIGVATASVWYLFASGMREAAARGDDATFNLGIVCGTYVWGVLALLGSLPPIMILLGIFA